MVFAELEVHIAQVRDFGGVGNGFGVIGEEGSHLCLRLHKELPGLKAHPAGLVQGLARLDAHEDVLHLRVLPAEIVGVVGGDEGDARLLTQADERSVHLLLSRDSVVLELQVIAVLPEEGAHLQCHFLGLVILPPQQQPGDLPGHTGGTGDQAAGVLPQQVQVDPWLNVKALQIALGHHVGQIAVALLVPAQEDQVVVAGVVLVDLLEPGPPPGGHIDLAADDGLHSRRLAGPVEVDHPVHTAVVGDGHRLLAQVLYPLHQLFDAAGAVQKGKFSVQV